MRHEAVRRLAAAALFGTALFAAGAVPSRALPDAPLPYRISGVVVSSRNGSPVPRCRISAVAMLSGEMLTPRAVPPNGPPSSPPSGVDRRPGRPGGGRGGSSLPSTIGQNLEAVADDSGRFVLVLPHAGGWRLAAVARGFRNQLYDEHEGFYSAVVLTEELPAHDLTFRVTPDSAVTGLVTDESAEPVISAQVMVEELPAAVPGQPQRATRPRPVGMATTDDRGRYELGGLAPGSYRLRVQAQPWYARAPAVAATVGGSSPAGAALPPDPSLDVIYPATWYPGGTDEAAADPIRLGPGEEREADFHLTAIPSVHLRIPRTDPRPDPPPGNDGQRGRQLLSRPATITRISADPWNYAQQVNATGMVGGDWDFGGLAPGSYEVRLPSLDGRGDGPVQQIEVRAGGQTVVTLDGVKSTVRLTLLFDGPADGDVELVDGETGLRIVSPQRQGMRGGFGGGPLGPPRSATDEGDGHTRTLEVPPHRYEVYLSGGQSYLTGISATGAEVSGRTVAIGAPANVTLHVATRRAQVEGVAHLGARPGDKAAAGAMVLLVPATLGQTGDLRAVERDETNTDGSFRLLNVVPGQYILAAIDHGWEVDWRNPATLTKYLLRGVPVDLTSAGKVRADVEAVEP